MALDAWTSLVVLVVSSIESYVAFKFIPSAISLAGSLGRLNFFLFISNILLVLVFRVFIYPFFLSPLRNIPGPKGGNFILGHSTSRVTAPKGEPMRQWMEEIPNDGLLYVRDVFNRDGVLPTTAEGLKTVLVDSTYDYEKPAAVKNVLRPLIGDGLVIVEGGAHKFQRKHLMPSFQLKVIRNLNPLFWSKACEMVNLLRPEAKNEKEIEVNSWTARATLDIIGVAAFGKDFNTLAVKDNKLVAQYHAVLDPDLGKIVWFALNCKSSRPHIDSSYHFADMPTVVIPQWILASVPFWQTPKIMSSTSKNLNAYALKLVKERRAALSNPAAKEAGEDDPKDILSLLVQSNDFNDRELADQALTIMAAGHETTSASLSWAVFLLAKYPEVQEKLRQEIRKSLPSPNDESHQALEAARFDVLPLLNGVINETNRLYPTVPFSGRVTIRDTVLSGVTLPKDTFVFLSLWAFNRYTKFWGEDALEFKPERWINPNGTPNNSGGASSNYALMTFIHGPRSCIGMGFAKAEMKCLLAAITGRYKMTLTREEGFYVPDGMITTKARDGMWVRLEEVPGW